MRKVSSEEEVGMAQNATHFRVILQEQMICEYTKFSCQQHSSTHLHAHSTHLHAHTSPIWGASAEE